MLYGYVWTHGRLLCNSIDYIYNSVWGNSRALYHQWWCSNSEQSPRVQKNARQLCDRTYFWMTSECALLRWWPEHSQPILEISVYHRILRSTWHILRMQALYQLDIKSTSLNVVMLTETLMTISEIIVIDKCVRKRQWPQTQSCPNYWTSQQIADMIKKTPRGSFNCAHMPY